MDRFACPACGGSAAAPHLSFRNGSIVRCASCDLMSTWPRAASADLYAASYYSGETATRFQVPLAEWAMRWFRRRRARTLAAALGDVAGKRMLDVGCGRGHTLLALQQMGADVSGTQISALAARRAMSLIGEGRVFQTTLGDAAFAPSTFDAVTLWHVLEHVSDPLCELTDAARVLKPAGLLYVEVPNAGGWTARRYGPAWLAWDVTHHVSHFTPSTLARLAAKAGFTVVREVHLSLEYSPPTLLQTWLNQWLGGDSRLFRAMTHDDDRDAPGGRVPLPIHVAAAILLLPAAVLVTLFLALRRDGDTLGVYFRPATLTHSAADAPIA
jgi:2-polyprenyl-3-methyl-5-hydroxy-6-metoxy-1,4-benzoquinol methylase